MPMMMITSVTFLCVSSMPMMVILPVTMVVISAMPMMVIKMSFLRMAPVPMVMIRVSILAVLMTILPVLVTMCVMFRVSLPFVSVVVIVSMSMTVSIVMPVMVVVIAMVVSFVMTARMSVSLVMAMCPAMSLVMTVAMSMAVSMPLVMSMSAAVSTSVSMAMSMVVMVAMMTRNIVVRDSCILVKGCNDRVAYFLHVLLLVLVLLLAGQLVLPDPFEGLVTLVQDGLLLVADLGLVQLRVLHPRLEVEAVSLETQLSFQALRLLHHLLNLVLGQPALVVGDGDLRLLAGRLVQGAHVQDAIGVNIKRDLNLRFSSRSWLDTTELKVTPM